jgi:hypothetical protein
MTYKWEAIAQDLTEENEKLRKALRELLADCDADLKPMGLHPARTLLRELGELK